MQFRNTSFFLFYFIFMFAWLFQRSNALAVHLVLFYFFLLSDLPSYLLKYNNNNNKNIFNILKNIKADESSIYKKLKIKQTIPMCGGGGYEFPPYNIY